jgi:hypothetical protein
MFLLPLSAPSFPSLPSLAGGAAGDGGGQRRPAATAAAAGGGVDEGRQPEVMAGVVPPPSQPRGLFGNGNGREGEQQVVVAVAIKGSSAITTTPTSTTTTTPVTTTTTTPSTVHDPRTLLYRNHNTYTRQNVHQVCAFNLDRKKYNTLNKRFKFNNSLKIIFISKNLNINKNIKIYRAKKLNI